MAYVDDPSQQQQDIQVAGATPLSTGQPTPAAQTQPEGGSGAPSGGQIQPQGDSAPRPQTGAQGSGKASSGQYTNIQKYVQKNQPQAQQMAGAVTQDVGRQAEAIRQQAAQKQAQQQQVLQANQQAITGAQDWATQQLQNIMQGVPTQEEGAPAFEIGEEQQKRFQALMRGEIEGVQDVGPLNIAEQQAKARDLQQMTEIAQTEAGRRQLLGETFRKQGEYTRGMSGLDELITGGDAAARQALTQGVMQQGEQLGAGLQGIAGESADAIAAQERALQEATTGLGTAVTEAETGIETEIQNQLEAERQAREDIVGEIDPLLNLSRNLARISSGIQGVDIGRSIGWFDFDLNKSIGDPVVKTIENMGEQEAAFYGIGPKTLRNLKNLVKRYKEEDVRHGFAKMDKLMELMDVARDNLRKIRSRGQIKSLQDELVGLGYNVGDIKAGTDIKRESVMSPEQIARYNALSKLTGQEDIITPQTYLSAEDLQKVLDMYRA